MQQLIWTTEKRIVNDLIPYEKNPRTISPKQLADLTKSLKKFNLVEIPAIDTDNTVLAGHQRLKVLQLLGRGSEEIDVRVPNRKLTEQEADQYLISSNALGGDWDFEKLKSFDLELLTDIGFDQVDLSKFWDEELTVQEEKFNPEKELKKIKRTDIELGDLIVLGDHKLLCADALDPHAIQALFGNDRAVMVYSDPIYNIGLDYDKGMSKRANYGGTVDDNKSAVEYTAFIRSSLEAAKSVTTPDAHYFYWCDEAWVWVFQTLYNELGIKNRRLNIWVKNNASPTPTVAFNKVTEFCVYGSTGSPYLSNQIHTLTEIQNPELGKGNELLKDLSNLWSAKRIKAHEYEHATSKPPVLHEKAIKRCTKPGDIILDSFFGSASTMVAAEQLKRRVFGTEIEPIFCQLAINRYEKLTGNKVQIIKRFYEKA